MVDIYVYLSGTTALICRSYRETNQINQEAIVVRSPAAERS